MRKFQKREIMECLQTLREACDEIEKLSGNGGIQNGEFINLCANTQEFCGDLYDYLESVAGEDTQTGYLVRELYEMLFQATQGEVEAKHLPKQIIKIGNMAANEMKPDKIEIVFFPYNASMWDSFESIYLAAKEDPDCDVYVVPIPWYKVNPDNSLGEFQYEGNKFPDNVPITHYNDYNLSERHPDVAFIHNPYDGGNNTSRVHPAFFSSEIKKYVDELIYVPYFVTDDAAGVGKHFALMPGVLNSDTVIVQSENVRRSYLKHIENWYREQGANFEAAFWEKKIVGLGSPKFDKAINTKREDCPLPLEWEKAIVNQNGSHKKVVLYNTSIGSFLQGTMKITEDENGEKIYRICDDYLVKLESVLKTFAGRKEVVLWWRPHPLLLTTCRANRPQIYERLSKLMREFQSMRGNFIYDDTPDLHRAIAWSDAYYGDGSSVTRLVAATGKPIMFQNIGVIDTGNNGENYKSYLEFDNLMETDNYYWTSPLAFNGLFRIDKQFWKAELVTFFELEIKQPWKLYSNGIVYSGKLYLPPCSADNIAIYDLTNNLLTTVPVPQVDAVKNEKYDSRFKFCRICEYKGLLYFLPSLYPGILILNPRTLETKIVDDWVSELTSLCLPDTKNGYLNYTLSTDNKSMLVVLEGANVVIEYSFEKYETQIYTLGDRTGGYCDIVQADSPNEYWLVSAFNYELILWNKISDTIKKYSFLEVLKPYYDEVRDNYKDIFDEWSYGVAAKYPFNSIVRREGFLYLTPQYFERMVQFDIEREIFSVVEDFLPESNCIVTSSFSKEEVKAMADHWVSELPFYGFCYCDRESIYLHTRRTNRLVEYSILSHSCVERGIKIDSLSLRKIKHFSYVFSDTECQHNHKSVSDFFIRENRYGIVLEDYIDALTNEPEAEWLQSYIRQMVNYMTSGKHTDEGAGESIFRLVKAKVL